MNSTARSRRPVPVSLWLAGVLVAAITLTPRTPSPAGRCEAFALTCGTTPAVDFILNLLLFLPLGAAAGPAFGRRAVGLLAILGPAAIELAQATIVPGRDPSARDVLANAGGTLIGALAAWSWRRLSHPSRREAAALAWLGGGFLSALFLAAALLLRPSVPASQWFGQYRAELGGFDRYPGRLVVASLGNQTMPPGLLPSPGFVQAVRELGPRIGAVVTPSPAETGRLAPIASVFDDRQRKIIMLAQHGAVLAFSPRLRAEDRGFQALVARFPELGLTAATDTLELRAAYAGGVLAATVRHVGGGEARVAEHALGPWDGWRLVLPRPAVLSRGTATAAGAVLLGLAFLPLGWYGGRWAAAGGRTALAPLPALVPALLALVPALGHPAAPWPCWLATALGWSLGRAAGAGARRGGGS